MLSRKKRRNGFTLVEIILVIVIIGIMAAIILPKFAGKTDSAKIAKTKANLASIRSALRLYQSDNSGTYPAALSDLVPDYIRRIPDEGVSDPPSSAVGASVDGSGGWTYDAATGEVNVNLSGNDSEGNAYSDY